MKEIILSGRCCFCNENFPLEEPLDYPEDYPAPPIEYLVMSAHKDMDEEICAGSGCLPAGM